MSALHKSVHSLTFLPVIAEQFTVSRHARVGARQTKIFILLCLSGSSHPLRLVIVTTIHHLPFPLLENSLIHSVICFPLSPRTPMNSLAETEDCLPSGVNLEESILLLFSSFASFSLTEASWGRDRSDGSNAGQMQTCSSRGIFSLSVGSPHIHRILSWIFFNSCIMSCFSMLLKHLATLQLLEASSQLFDTPTSCWFPQTFPDSPSK